MSYNILNKGVKFQGDTQGTIEDIVDTHSTQTVNGLKTVTHLTGTHVRVTNDAVVLGNVSASINISASAFYANGVLVDPAGSGISFDGSTANGLLTYKDADEATVESSLTFDGSVLDFKTTSISGSGNISGSAFYGNGSALTGIDPTVSTNGGLLISGGNLSVDITNATEENTTDKEDDYLLFYDNGVGLRKTKLKNVANLFDAAVTQMNNKVENRLVTIANTTTQLDGEAVLTFDGSTLSITGDVSGSNIISGSIGHFVTRVEASAISIGDATGLAGLGLANSSGELDVQVSGALKVASDKVGITGSIAGNGIMYEGGVDSISSLKLDLGGLTEAAVNRSNDFIVFIDADDSGNPKKESIVDFVGFVAGSGLDASSGQLAVDVSDFMTNGSDNSIVTATGADGMNAEANLTFDGSLLTGTNITSSFTHYAAGVISGIGDTQTAYYNASGSNTAVYLQFNEQGNTSPLFAVAGTNHATVPGQIKTLCTLSSSADINVVNVSGSGHLVIPNTPSGSIAGAGSYLGLGADGKVVLTSSAGGGGAVSAVANGSDNRITTFSSSDALNGEANLQFDGTTLSINGAEGDAGAYSKIVFRKTSIADNSATAVVRFTVPNANHAACFRIFGLITTDSGSRVGTFEHVIAISRTSGAAVVSAQASGILSAEANSGGGGANYTIAGAPVDGTEGASATNTVDYKLTINTTDSSTTNAVCYVELLNFNSTGITMAAV